MSKSQDWSGQYFNVYFTLVDFSDKSYGYIHTKLENKSIINSQK